MVVMLLVVVMLVVLMIALLGGRRVVVVSLHRHHGNSGGPGQQEMNENREHGEGTRICGSARIRVKNETADGDPLANVRNFGGCGSALLRTHLSRTYCLVQNTRHTYRRSEMGSGKRNRFMDDNHRTISSSTVPVSVQEGDVRR